MKNYNTNLSLSSILDVVYPIGSVYISFSPVDPSTLFGGTWERLNDCFLWGVGAYSNSDIGKTGGEMTHTLTQAEMPSHIHRFEGGSHTWAWGANSGTVSVPGANAVSGGSAGNPLFTIQQEWAKTVPTGGNGAHNNMPPYVCVAMFQRIS